MVSCTKDSVKKEPINSLNKCVLFLMKTKRKFKQEKNNPTIYTYKLQSPAKAIL